MGNSERGIVGVPRVPEGMLPRAALAQRLGHAPLTVVRAPGGSGKTVLLAQWAAVQPRRGVWITVESDIGSRMAFWNSVLEAASAAGLVPRSVLEDVADREVLRRDLLAILRGIGDLVLVIDDAHELRDPLVEEDVLALLRACPGLVVLVGTRTRGELEAPRQALTLDVTVLEPEALVLGIDEVERLAGADSGHGTAAELLAASGGNPLLLRALLAGPGHGPGARASAHATMSDHLRHLFASRGPEAAGFAAATAVPDDVDAELATRLSGLDATRVGELLALFETEGLVMSRDAGGVVRHRYHPLVRDVLRDDLRRDHPEQYRHASLLASAAAEARRQYLPALRHAVDAEDYVRASDVVLHGGITLLRSRGAAAILQRVPLRFVARLPFLAIVLGLAANARGERLKALELLALALGASRALRTRQRVAERIGLALIESVVLRITGRAEESATAARRMATLLDEAAPGDLEEIAEQEGAYRHQGALSLFRAGRLAEARLAAERAGISAHALAERGTDTLGAAALVAAIEAARGEVVAAAATLARIDAAGFPVELRDGYVGSLAHLAAGVVALEAGDIPAADRVVELLRGRANLEHGTLVVALQAAVSLWRGTPDVGLSALDAREGVDRPRARLSAQDRRVAAAARAMLHAAAGRFGAAHTALRALDRGDPLAPVLGAGLLLLEQRPDLAVETLARTSSDAGPRLAAAADLLLAAASLELGDRPRAESALRRFTAISEVHGIASPLVLLAPGPRDAVLGLADELGVAAATLDLWRGMPSPFRPSATRVTLTRREIDVLAQLRTTGSLPEVAAALNVSSNTVKTQVRTMYRKLGVSTREDALRVAYLQGLLDARD